MQLLIRAFFNSCGDGKRSRLSKRRAQAPATLPAQVTIFAAWNVTITLSFRRPTTAGGRTSQWLAVGWSDGGKQGAGTEGAYDRASTCWQRIIASHSCAARDPSPTRPAEAFCGHRDAGTFFSSIQQHQSSAWTPQPLYFFTMHANGKRQRVPAL